MTMLRLSLCHSLCHLFLRCAAALGLLLLLLLAAPAWWAVPAHAAEVQPADYERMRLRAINTGHAPVQVNLTPLGKGFEYLVMGEKAYTAFTRQAADALLAELGSEVRQGGKELGIGMVHLWVTARGLELLRASSIATALSQGSEWNHHILLGDLDGSLAATDKRLRSQGKVDVEVTVQVEGAGITIDASTGRSSLEFNHPAQPALARAAANQLLADVGLPPGTFTTRNRTGTLVVLDSLSAERTGTVVLRADELGLVDLARHRSVIAIRPLGWLNDTPLRADPDALDQARRYGRATAIISLRMGYSGPLSTATSGAQRQSYRRMLEDALAPFTPLQPPQWLDSVGAVIVDLDLASLEQLASSRDMRLWGFSGNRPISLSITN